MEFFRRRKWRMRVLWVITPGSSPWTVTAQREREVVNDGDADAAD